MFGDILNPARAIFFFATPHQGSDTATWAAYLSKIGRVIGVTGTEVTAELVRWSNPLLELTKVFSENQERIAITTLYETRTMHDVMVSAGLQNRRPAFLLTPASDRLSLKPPPPWAGRTSATCAWTLITSIYAGSATAAPTGHV